MNKVQKYDFGLSSLFIKLAPFLLVSVWQFRLSWAKLDFSDAPELQLTDLIHKDIPQIEFYETAHCKIQADEVFVFICTEDAAKKNGGKGLSPSQLKVVNQVVIADSWSVVSDDNCVKNCLDKGQRPSSIVKGTYDFLKIENAFKADQVKQI